MCGHHTEVPKGFIEEMDRSALNDEEHPEFVHGSMDYVAPAHIDVDGPQQSSIPTTCFVVESSAAAVSSGLFHSALYSIDRILEGESPELKMRRRVCLVTFDEAVHFHELTKGGNFRQVSMCDTDDPFAPLSPQASFVNIADDMGRDSFRYLLQYLQANTFMDDPCSSPTSSSSSRESHSAAGAALRVSVEAVAQTGGGDVCIFHATTPSAGIGAVLPSAPEDTKEDIQQAAFYQDTLALCVKGGVAVSSVVAPTSNVKLDLRTLQWLPQHTGGDFLHMPDFSGKHCYQKLESHMTHWAKKMQASAYGCVFKLRCSKGLACTSLLAPWPAASSSSDGSAFELPRLTPDASFAITLQPELDSTDEDDVRSRRDDKKKQLFLQAAILYTNGEGERLLRIHTTLISVVYSVRAFYQSLSMEPLIAVMLKQAALVALDTSKKKEKLQPKDHLLETCLQVLKTYRRHCYTSDVSPSSLVVSKSLSLLPLYVLAARKLMYSMGMEKDEACRRANWLRILRMPIHSIIIALYPRAHALPVPSAGEADSGNAEPGIRLPDTVQDSKNLERALATPCPALQEHVAKGPSPAYIIANGFNAWLLKTESGNSVDEQASESILELAKKACERIEEQLQYTASPMPLSELPAVSATSENTWQEQVRLATLFVEDEGATEMSYPDWVEFLQHHVKEMLREG
jgi:hypothetical protein